MADEIENTEAEDQAIEDAAFAATMAESVGDVKSPPEAVKPGVEEVKIDEETAAQSTEKVVERVEVFNGMTAEELEGNLSKVSTLQKALDTANGTHGSQLQQLNATIANLRSAKQEAPALTADSLKNLQEDYPELAVKLAQDLAGVVPDEAAIERKIAASIDERWNKRQQEDANKERVGSLSRLTEAHPDWEKVAGISESNGMMKFNDLKFGNWVAAQPEDIQEQIINGSDVSFLTAKITEYKKTLKPTKSTKPDLNLALIPDGNTKNEQTFESDDDETEAAYRATMKKLAQG